MRKLASIQTINAIEPIENADAIEKLRVLGWWVVAKKGEHRVGEKVIYCEIDSLLPEQPAFEFLRASSFKPAQLDFAGQPLLPAGFRIKTIRLRGQVSQGICFPLSIAPSGVPTDVGTDLTDLLGIHKWEAPVSLGMSGRILGPFPEFLSKTDEIRVQVLENVLKRHRGKTFFVTEKLDGTSFTAFVRGSEFGVCTRNFWIDPTDQSSMANRLAGSLKLEEKLRAAQRTLGFDIAVQGELLGPAIQKNKYRLPALTLYVFNVINIESGRLLDHDAATALLAELQIAAVPELGTLVLDHSIDELVAMAQGKSLLNPEIQREGLVFRPAVEEFDEDTGGRLSFKVINPHFLLKYDE